MNYCHTLRVPDVLLIGSVIVRKNGVSLQVTVPVNARKVLGLESGDILGFFWDGERIVLRKVS